MARQTQHNLQSEIGQFVLETLAQELIGELATFLKPQNAYVMPLKGVLLKKLIYDQPQARKTSDVDLLVSKKSANAIKTLFERKKFKRLRESKSGIQEIYESPEKLHIDVHYELFGAHRFGLTASAMLERATLDTSLFCAEVLLPDPLDLYAHLLGKLVTDHVAVEVKTRWQDLKLVASKLDLCPQRTANHLEKCGMKKAAHYVLPILSEHFNDDFSNQVFSYLGNLNPLEKKTLIFAHQCIQQRTSSYFSPRLGAHLLNTSFSQSVASMSVAAFKHLNSYLKDRNKKP